MASNSLAKLQSKLQSAQRSRVRANDRRKMTRARDAAVAGGTAYIVGAIEANTGPLPTIANADPKLLWGGLGLGLGLFVTGTAGELLTAGSEGILIAAAYQSGRGDQEP
jgi:hypothetical protein